ncbi:MAG: DUF2007 domain-containing protein [Acidobacteriota bacterium]
MAKKTEEWVEVAQTGQDEEALLISGLLHSQGIPSEVEGPSNAAPLPENLGAFGMSRVMVPPDRAQEARDLLARQEKEYRRSPKETSGE